MSKRGSSSSGPPGKAKRSRKNEEEEEEEGEELEFSQFQPPSPVKTSENKCAEYGIIEHISMKNFMCHDRLEFDFGSHINFLVGRNGSGKSAVLTALVVGLGGKASSTNRGTSIKNFIKHGKNKAYTCVRLKNRGTDAFKPHEYGDSITVERHFSADGASSYKMKAHDGRVVSTKRDELSHILDQFNIQVDNPVAVLNQEISKCFLSSGKPSNYYRFFLKATQLEQMQLDYVEAHENRQKTINIVETKKKTLPNLEAELAEWEAKYRVIMSLDELRLKVATLKNELAWAFVAEKERGLAPMVKALRTEEARTPKFELKIQQSKEKVERTLKEKEAVHQKLQTMSTDVRTVQPQLDKAKALVLDKKKKHREAVMEMRRLDHEMKSQVKDKKQMEDRIHEIRASTQNNEAERAERERKIRALTQDMDSVKEQRATRELDMERFQTAAANEKNHVRTLKNEERELQTQLQDIQRRLTDLEGSRSNNLARYGRGMPQLLQKIDDAHKRGRFHQKPRGPIGALIHPKNPVWALAIETALKRLIQSFCCHDHHDEAVLEQLVRECNLQNKPDTIVSKFIPNVHDVSEFRAGGKYPTIYDMLDIKDPVVANCLIDQRRIENIILIEDKIEARQVMEKNAPPKCSYAFTPNGDQLFHHPSFKIYSNNNQRSSYLSVNVERELGLLREQAASVSKQLAAAQDKVKKKQRDAMKNEEEERKVERQLRQLRDQLNRKQMEIQELQNIEEPAPADIIALEEEVEKYDETIEKLETNMKEKKTAAEKAKIDLETASEEQKVLEEKMNEFSENADPLREALADVEYRIEAARQEKKHYDNKMKEHHANLKDQADRIAAFKVDIEEKVRMASEICDRCEVERSPRDLESEIIQIQKQIETQERTQGDKKHIVEQYHKKTEQYKDIDTEVKRFNTFLERMEKGLIRRRQKYLKMRRFIASRTRNVFIVFCAAQNYNGKLEFDWNKSELRVRRLKGAMNSRHRAFSDMRRLIAVRTRYIFITMLSSRHYMGKLIFDHKAETLTVSVQPTVSESGQGSKDVRALSGGERSFSTVCFILSLWQAMESPFRCLDEFDVFMDMVNRRISMGMMMKAAQDKPQNQFIFLTPLDISTMDVSANTNIYRMPDPERDDTAEGGEETAPNGK